MKLKRNLKLVSDSDYGTAFLRCCLYCSQKIGEPHLQGCEATTGEAKAYWDAYFARKNKASNSE